jgi:tellurite resistance protein
MFIQNLTREQQEVFLHLAMNLVKVDGEFSEEEDAMLSVLKFQCEEGVEAKKVEMTALPSIFDNQTAKVSALLELTAIAFADGIFHHKEAKLLQEIVAILDIDYLYEDCKNWAEQQLALMDKAETLMSKQRPSPEKLSGWLGVPSLISKE